MINTKRGYVMAKIFIQLRKDTAYLEEQAQADSNFPWADYSYSPPIVSSDGKKILPLNSVSKYLEDLKDPAAYTQINNALDQIAIMAGLLEHDNGNSSGIVELPQETIDQIRSMLEPAGLATFTQVNS
jgi:hypothetical protein